MTGKIHWGQSKTIDNLLLLEGFAGDQRFYIQQFRYSPHIFVLTNLQKRTISGKNVEELKAMAETWLELAASQPAEPVSVKVKPLVWDKFAEECYSWRAPLFGSVVVKRHRKGNWVVVWSTPGYTEIFVHGQFHTPDEAKAAAEARIIAAMDVQPITVQDAARVPEIAAMIEALEWQNSWLSAALTCPAWVWDADQRELAEQHLAEGIAALRAIAEKQI